MNFGQMLVVAANSFAIYVAMEQLLRHAASAVFHSNGNRLADLSLAFHCFYLMCLASLCTIAQGRAAVARSRALDEV